MSELIITLKHDSISAGLNECLRADEACKLKYWLDQEVGLIQLNKEFNQVARYFQDHPPVFIQHICPVQQRVAIKGKQEDIEVLLGQCQQLQTRFVKEKSFSVQTRMLGKGNRSYKRFEVNQAIAEMIKNLGWELNVSRPEQIISIVIAEDVAYLGVSMAEQNLSDWAGGQHRFATEKGQISRAEFKLLEALDVFQIEIQPDSMALDLGAAPGGWTRILLKKGCRVYAVDPALLDPSLQEVKQFTHFRQTAQDFLKQKKLPLFDLIVNDMKMDVNESIRLMGKMHRLLQSDGIAIMTLKLQKKQLQKVTNQAIKRLASWYKIIGARQLFHNRSEVTVVLGKKDK
ncbi:23S rRNA (cytidine2498-2'-O)-methyltransferase [Seinonella peptonophila]|uniref:23S rRNA (Cytidine2498-2'-O)-methyltransferase n=1 Tax=Seinonella peptonophila TaxID=112248 RepID=A0A1M4TDL4_9BACL|nr:SAM-dependent methyltransferase [Seinonella peptonophila]SHE42540.1 23S rRNA (cytidine2498-2'-O)-methyltransferase [Seinonella peptonophila]